MSFFAVYAGLMYNDFMSVPLNLFDSCYNKVTGLRKDANCVYPMGIDPIWYGNKLELIFMNSFKMKFAVIVGVLHMVLGLAQKALNAIYFKDRNKLLHEFLPQIIFLLAVFGYMDVLIIVKWFTNYKGHEHEAPSIIVTIVNFFLDGGSIKGRPFFAHNTAVEQFLLLIAVACLPWMLLVKPYLEWQEEKSKHKERIARGGDYELDSMPHRYEVFYEENF